MSKTHQFQQEIMTPFAMETKELYENALYCSPYQGKIILKIGLVLGIN